MKRAARRARPALWTCPRCGRSTLEAHFARAAPEIVAAFRAVEDALRGIGAVSIEPVKTMITIKTRRIIAAVRLLRSRLEIHFNLPRRIESPRFEKIVSPTRTTHIHVLRVASRREIDAEVRAWLREAFDASLEKPRARAARGDRDDRPFGSALDE